MPNYRKPENNVSMEQFQSLVLRVEALEAKPEPIKEEAVKEEPAKEEPAKEEEKQDTTKADLIEKAVELGIGPKSTLSRWSVDKLTTEIDKAK